MIAGFRLVCLALAAALAAAGGPSLAAAGPAAATPPEHRHAVSAGPLEIVHPWSRATPGGARVAAGYLVVRNAGEAPDRLLSVAAPAVAAGVEIHEMRMTGGVMSMRRLPDGLPIPAGGTVSLAPGGLHLMLTGLKRPLAQGETFAATLTFERAGTVEVAFTVEATGAAQPSMPAGHGGPDGHHHH
jgi:periplasmic copper chaperone A